MPQTFPVYQKIKPALLTQGWRIRWPLRGLSCWSWTVCRRTWDCACQRSAWWQSRECRREWWVDRRRCTWWSCRTSSWYERTVRQTGTRTWSSSARRMSLQTNGTSTAALCTWNHITSYQKAQPIFYPQDLTIWALAAAPAQALPRRKRLWWHNWQRKHQSRVKTSTPTWNIIAWINVASTSCNCRIKYSPVCFRRVLSKEELDGRLSRGEAKSG